MNTAFDFSEIGLSSRDKRVYEAFTQWPQSSLRAVAEETGINRGSVYESVKVLLETGLITAVVGKQTRYAASNPAIILELLAERQLQAAAAQRSARNYIATLTPVRDVQAVPTATYYEDYEGVAAVLRDVITTCKQTPSKSYRVISTGLVREHLYENFRNFTQRRIAAGITVQVIGVGAPGSKDPLSERRLLPAHRGTSPNCYTIIYGTKTVFITRTMQAGLSAVMVDDNGVTQLQKELFDQLWEHLAA